MKKLGGLLCLEIAFDYYVNEKSINTICNERNHDSGAVKAMLKRYGFRLRSRAESTSLGKYNNQSTYAKNMSKLTDDQLKHWYCTKLWSVQKIADTVGTTYRRVRQRLLKLDVPIRTAYGTALAQRARRINNPIEGRINQHILRELYEDQNHACAICGIPISEDQRTTGSLKLRRSVALDHDHTTGLVRGLLCVRCNTGLGHFKDCQKTLRSAIKYLQKPLTPWVYDPNPKNTKRYYGKPKHL